MTTGIPAVGFYPAPGAAAVTPYRVVPHGAPIVLDLASTAGALSPQAAWLEGAASLVVEAIAQYPNANPLTTRLAAAVGVAPEQVLVTAGADEALERAFRAMLGPGDEVILTSPTFEMLPRYARLLGATIVEVSWPSGAIPVAEIEAAITPCTRLIAIVTPNNPTGAAASLAELQAIKNAAPNALLVVDLAYVEFADDDPTASLLREPGVVVTRTFSKAWGLPGIRVGWAAGPAEVIEWMRRVGNPYSVSAPSLALAEAALVNDSGARAATVAAVRSGRERLTTLLNQLDLNALPTQANFVCASPVGAPWLRNALAGLGVAIRYLPDPSGDRIRVSCPLPENDWQLLEHALRTAVTPEAMIFDMDGVLADVSRSYRQAIITTAGTFGVTVGTEEIAAAKAAGNANDDWQLTTDLLNARGASVALSQVKERFESIYQGAYGRPGLREEESLLIARDVLADLAERFRLGIATGRPRADAERFLARFELDGLFPVVVTKEDGPIKPDPFTVREAMQRLGVTRAWMIGDTPDDIRAARAAGALPVGVLPPDNRSTTLAPALLAAGAAWVLPDMNAFEEILP